MKKAFRYLTISLLLSLNQSCGNKPTTAGDINVITVTNDNPIEIGEIIDAISFVSLGAGQENIMLGDIDGLIVTDGYFILIEKYLNQKVSVFDMSGRHISTIDKKGRGPEEYISISHVSLTSNGDIALYDNFGSKVILYDIEGNFIKSNTVDFNFRSFEFVDNDYVICATANLGKKDYEKNLIVFADPDFRIEAGTLPNRYSNPDFSWLAPHLVKSNGEVYMNPTFSDTLYHAKHNTVVPLYKLDSKAIGGISSLGSDVDDHKVEDILETKTAFSGDFAVSDHYLLFNLTFPPDRILQTYAYNKAEEKLYRLDNSGDLFTSSLSRAMTCYDNRFYAVVPAHHINIMVPEEIRANLPPLSNLSDDSNPVIFAYTLKKDINKEQ